MHGHSNRQLQPSMIVAFIAQVTGPALAGGSA
jgi:hypothetical protein